MFEKSIAAIVNSSGTAKEVGLETFIFTSRNRVTVTH